MFSMTGYGKGVASEGGRSLTVELKSVNHRYLDLGLKLPRNLMFLEDALKSRITSRLSRGHVDVFLTYEQPMSDAGVYVADVALAKSYVSAACALNSALDRPLENDLTLATVLKAPDVMVRKQPAEDEQLLAKLAEQAVDEALDNLLAMRGREGAALEADIALKLDSIAAAVDVIGELAPAVVEGYRIALNTRIAEAVAPSAVDAQRLATEVALFADRCAIDEELTRLKAHIAAMRKLIATKSEPVGRKMDFLVQEFNREANTIASKANDLKITNKVLEIKNDIEKMREQAANIE